MQISLNRKSNLAVKLLLGALALFILLGVLNLFSSVIKNSFLALSSPLQKTFWTAGESSSGFFASFVNASTLSNNNKVLESQVQQLQSQIAALKSVTNANQAQLDITTAMPDSRFTLLMSSVVGLDSQDILSISKGSADGVQTGMPVVGQQGALYGKVVKVYKNFSDVMLISSKTSVISVKVLQSDPNGPEIDGVVRGNAGLGTHLDLVPIDNIINPGDVLVTSALDASYPKDLLVGTITKVEKNDQNPHQGAQMIPYINTSAENVFVILNYKQS